MATTAHTLTRKPARRAFVPRSLPHAIVAVLVTLCILLPLYWMVLSALMPTEALLSRHPPLLPDPRLMSTHAFAEVLLRRPLLAWIGNSALVALGSVAISLVASTLAGYSLSRYRSPAQELAGLTLLVSKMLPGSLIVIPLFIMAASVGLLDNLASLMLANASVGVPFATWMMKGFFDGLPRDLDAAARVDGCSELGVLWHVILPIARPGLGACAIYLFIVAWADFVFVRTLINKPNLWTVTVGLASFVGEHSVDWPQLMAAGTLSTLPMLGLFLIFEPFLLEGMANGAVK